MTPGSGSDNRNVRLRDREDDMADGGMNVTKLASKSHNEPDEVRSPAKTRVEVVRLPGFTLGRLNMEPGWKWSECVKPVVKTESCQVSAASPSE